MLVLFRWMFAGFVTLLVLAGLAGGFAWHLATRSLPQYDRAFVVERLDAPVEILRDNHAIPHVFGPDDASVMFGFGFVHAQDRLWQMEMMRRTAQGRLSELFGPRTLETDELMRALRLYPIAQEAVLHQEPQVLALLQAYSDGVNAMISAMRAEARGRGAPEFFLFDAQISPWTPADSIVLIKLMGLQLTDKAALEVLRARAAGRLSPQMLSDLMPDPEGTPIREIPEFARFWHDHEQPVQVAQGGEWPQTPFYPLNTPGTAGASNVWAAGPERSASRAPLLASDPHLGLTAPGIWYPVRLELSTGGVIGGSIPGIPAVLIGRSNRLAWGLTASGLDDQDLFLERVNPADPEEYLTEDGPQAFDAQPSIIQIRGEAPRTVILRRTRNGPVIPGDHFGLDALRIPGHEFALSWTALEVQDRTIGAAIGLMQAQDVAAAQVALAGFHAPSLNIMLADPASIALVSAGAMPRRDPAHQTRGRLPAPGWENVNTWQGHFPYSDNPQVQDPDGGALLNTNNSVSDAEFPAHFSYDWGDTQRIRRAAALLGARQFHTRDSFVEMQTDIISVAARTLLPLMGRELWFADSAAEPGTHAARRRQALDLLSNWNGEMGEHAPEPLIYAAWVRALQNRIILDELGVLARFFHRPDPLFLERVLRDVDGAGVWCDVITTDEVETCQQIASIALDDALAWLVQKHGDSIGRWRWGAAHMAWHRSEVLGDIPVVGWFANLWEETPGGDYTLMRGQTYGRGDNPFVNVHAAGLRMVVTFDNPDSSIFVTATGVSGHFLSRHYDDLTRLWRRGEYIPMALDPALVRGGSVGVTRLVPGGQATNGAP